MKYNSIEIISAIKIHTHARARNRNYNYRLSTESWHGALPTLERLLLAQPSHADSCLHVKHNIFLLQNFPSALTSIRIMLLPF